VIGGAFVGRESDLAELHVALDHAEAGHGGLALVTGEAGIGKTTLLDAAMAEAEQRGVLVCRGNCWPDAGAPPYWPWVQVLRQTAGVVPPPELAGGAPTSVGDADAARFRLFDDVVAHLRAVAARTPVLIVLEDIQHALWRLPIGTRSRRTP
jgi:predicted ATPase